MKEIWTWMSRDCHLMRDCRRNNEKKKIEYEYMRYGDDEKMDDWTHLEIPGHEESRLFFLKITMHVGISVFLP